MNRYEVTLKAVSPFRTTDTLTYIQEAHTILGAVEAALALVDPHWEVTKLKVKKVRR